jgi:hypothetical protein
MNSAGLFTATIACIAAVHSLSSIPDTPCLAEQPLDTTTRPQSPFDVVVWVRKGAGFHALRDDLLRIAVGDPCASTEYEGMVDFHWRFNSCGKP